MNDIIKPPDLNRTIIRPERAPNPVPDKHRSEMTIEEQQKFERWAGINPDTNERNRRRRVLNRGGK